MNTYMHTKKEHANWNRSVAESVLQHGDSDCQEVAFWFCLMADIIEAGDYHYTFGFSND